MDFQRTKGPVCFCRNLILEFFQTGGLAGYGEGVSNFQLITDLKLSRMGLTLWLRKAFSYCFSAKICALSKGLLKVIIGLQCQ